MNPASITLPGLLFDNFLVALITNLTADNLPLGYSASASSTNSGAGYHPWNAFSTVNGSGWLTLNGVPQWLQIQIPTAKKAVQVSISNRYFAQNGTGNIGNWSLSGSNDGAAFTGLVDYTTAITSSGVTPPTIINTATFVNITPYSYYRINFSTAGGFGDTYATDVQLYGQY